MEFIIYLIIGLFIGFLFGKFWIESQLKLKYQKQLRQIENQWNEEKLKYAKPDAIVMHPGPINRGVEIASEVADGPRSVILNQVTFGIAVRMAVMSMAISGQDSAPAGGAHGS